MRLRRQMSKGKRDSNEQDNRARPNWPVHGHHCHSEPSSVPKSGLSEGSVSKYCPVGSSGCGRTELPEKVKDIKVNWSAKAYTWLMSATHKPRDLKRVIIHPRIKRNIRVLTCFNPHLVGYVAAEWRTLSGGGGGSGWTGPDTLGGGGQFRGHSRCYSSGRLCRSCGCCRSARFCGAG